MPDYQFCLNAWHEAATTRVRLFWMALGAFVLGHLVSGMMQVFLSRGE